MSNPRRSAPTKPLSIRLTDAERAALEARAGSVALGAYIRSVVLAEAATHRATPSRSPVRDSDALGRVLGLLGQSRLASNLNQLAKAVNLGSLPVTETTEADLRRACADVADMRRALLAALGVQRAEGDKEVPRLAETFEAMAEGAPS